VKQIKILFFLMSILFSTTLFAEDKDPTSNSKKKTFKKVQEVNFEEMDLKGTVRNPDGAYLVQKRGIQFYPLFEIHKEVDSKIRESIDYVR
jgi:hypothetical protein